MPIDPKKAVPSLITPDWTRMDPSKAFFQKALVDRKDRYSISVETDATSTEKSNERLEEIKNGARRVGFTKILEFYNKKDSDPSKLGTESAEDWYLPERPDSTIKVLISIDTAIVDSLKDKPPPEGLPQPWKELYFNTSDIEGKIKGVSGLLRKYDRDIYTFYGKVKGLDLSRQAQLLLDTVTPMASLMSANGFTFDRSVSNLLVFGIDENYRLLYGQINTGCSFENLYIDFLTFSHSTPMANVRTIHLLDNLDKLNETQIQGDQIAWSEFIKTYILNPPDIDFSSLPRRSGDSTDACRDDVEQDIREDANNKNAISYSELIERDSKFAAEKETWKNVLDTSAEFVGDSMVSGLGTIVDGLTLAGSYKNVVKGNRLEDGLFKDLLNKIPIQNLIAAAMECLGIKGFDFLSMSKQLLNQLSGALSDVASLLGSLPNMTFPDDFPIADYMSEIGKQIKNAIVEAVITVLLEAIVAIIEQLLDLCNECALQNEAAGKSRFDGLNFGGLDLGGAFVRGTVGALTKEISSQTGYEQMAAQAWEETEEWAANPALIANRMANASTGVNVAVGATIIGLPAVIAGQFVGEVDIEKHKQLIQQSVQESKQEVGDFMRASATILTPGEMGNMLLGCGVGKQPVKAVEKLLDKYPNIKAAFADDPEYKIKKMFENIGKLFGPNPILQAVKEATDAIPEELRCLCDEDDSEFRRQLLEDRLTPGQIDEQLAKAKERKKTRLTELAGMLNKPNILEGMEPAIYCTMVYRNAQGEVVSKEKVDHNPIDDTFHSRVTGERVYKGIKPGLIKNDPDNFTFALDQTLNTIYNSIHMGFNTDINEFVPLLTQDTWREREILRTKLVRTPGGDQELVVNPEWTKMVKGADSAYSYGSLPADAAQPNKNIEINTTFGIESSRDNEVQDDDEIGGDARDAMVAGQMQSAQVVPTGLQESTWEATMKFRGGALTAKGRRRPNEYGGSDAGVRMADYTRIYGWSPIPIIVKEKGPKEFVPGLQPVFEEMCDVTKGHFVVRDSGQTHFYSFDVPVNIFKAAGIDFGQLNRAASAQAGSVDHAAPDSISSDMFQQGMSAVAEGLNFLNNAAFKLDYFVPYKVPVEDENFQIPVDRYGLTLTMVTKTPGRTAAMSPLVLYNDIASFSLIEPIKRIFERRALTEYWNSEELSGIAPYIPQEKTFVALNQDAWENGSTIYRKGKIVGVSLTQSFSGEIVPRPSYSAGLEFYGVGAQYGQNIGSQLLAALKLYMYEDIPGTVGSTYDGLWNDFYCSLTKQISESPFMKLKGLSQLTMTPMNEMGQDLDCDPYPSLLDVETIKKRVKTEYGLIQCIEASYCSVDGVKSNKDNPFERANLGGAVLLTIRTYVLEILLRSLGAFYWFRYANKESIDSLLVSYIRTSLKQDITRRNFIGEFQTEALALYNRNATNIGRTKTNDFDFVLEYFIRNQIYGVSNRLGKTCGTIGDTSLDTILIQDWIPEYNVPATVGEWRIGVPPQQSAVESQQLPADLAMQLFGDGSLSTKTIKAHSGERLTFDFALGHLFRDYFAGRKEADPAHYRPGSAPHGIPQPGMIWAIGNEPIQGHYEENPTNISTLPVDNPATDVDERQDALDRRMGIGFESAQRSSIEPYSREYWILAKSGIIDGDSNSRIQRQGATCFTNFGINIVDYEDFLLEENPSPSDIPYRQLDLTGIGVSRSEKNAMATFVKMIALALPSDYWSTPCLERLRGLTPEVSAITGGGTMIGRGREDSQGNPQLYHIYPGWLLKKISETGAAHEPWTFEYDNVWDTFAWANGSNRDGTGREPPKWFRDLGVEVPIPQTLSFYAGGPRLVDRSFSTQYHPRENNLWRNFYNRDHIFDDKMQVPPYCRNPEGGVATGFADSLSCFYDSWAGEDGYPALPASQRPRHRRGSLGQSPEENGRLLRWVKLDGMVATDRAGNEIRDPVIGPWRGFEIEFAGDANASDAGGDRTIRWKFIDPHYEYTDKGVRSDAISIDWEDLKLDSFDVAPTGCHSVTYSRWKFVDGNDDEVDIGDVDQSQTPPRHIDTGERLRQVGNIRVDWQKELGYCLGSGDGYTIGANMRDAARFGLQFTGRQNLEVRKHLNRANDLLKLGMPYYSLLDFPLAAIPEILKWEMSQVDNYVEPGTSDFQKITDLYAVWIRQAEDALEGLESAENQRMRIQNEYFELLYANGVQRRESPSGVNPGTSWENGNFIKEYYLRVEELPYQGMPRDGLQTRQIYWDAYATRGQHEQLTDLSFSGLAGAHGLDLTSSPEEGGEQYRFPVEEAKWMNSNYVDKGRTEFMKGVININAFQDYIDSRFPDGNRIPQGTGPEQDPCPTKLLTKALLLQFPEYKDCGKAMARELGIRLSDHANYVLSDFFKSVHLGVRISYVVPPQPWHELTVMHEGEIDPETGDYYPGSEPIYEPEPPPFRAPPPLAGSGLFAGEACWRYHHNDPVLEEWPRKTWKPLENPFLDMFNSSINPSWRNGAGQLITNGWDERFNPMYDKAFFVKEYRQDIQIGIPASHGGTYGRQTDQQQREHGFHAGQSYPSSRWVHTIPIVCVEKEIDPWTAMSDIADQTKTGRFTKKEFDEINFEMKDVNIGFLEHIKMQNVVNFEAQLKETEEFKLLFKYLFPIDRMLSLSNIYASSYMSTFKGINDLLDGTKTKLKRLFFAILQSPKDGNCGPSNLDLQLASLNGLDIEGLLTQLAMMIVKAALLIFKGFTEVFDPNIAVSKFIIQGIHLSNQIIAAGAMMANQAQEMGDAASQFANQFGGEDCKESPPHKPPDTWFDPIEENLIPEPNIVFISLALLPITLLPLFWPGIPITPFGLAYWGLDWKPEVNWLQAYPPADWLDKLVNKDELDQGGQECGIDAGLPPLIGPGEDNGGE